MTIDPEVLGAEIEDSYFERGGGGGGGRGKKEKGEHHGKRTMLAIKESAKESGEKGKEAKSRITAKLSKVLEKDESLDAREVKAYFEWLKLALLCVDEICSMKEGKFGDQKLALEMMMRDSDLEEKFVRSGGAGGQNVNKVNSAVQIKHVPSGFFVKVSESRDQFQNRPIARQRLQQVLCDHLDDWKTVIGARDENEAMSEIFGEVLESKGEVKGVRGDVLKKVAMDLKEGINL